MAPKRKAQEAFGRPNGHLSAVAAAKLARQSTQLAIPGDSEESSPSATNLATALANTTYEERGGTPSPPRETDAGRSTTRLSTFLLTKGKSSFNADSEQFDIILELNETITFVGQYDLQVLGGIVTIYGSVVRPDSGIQRVYAPSTHALPLLHARQENTRLRISSCKSSLAKLSKLSPLFRNIWTAPEIGHSFTPIGASDEDPLQRFLTAVNIERETDAVLRTLSAKVAVESRQSRIVAFGAKSSGKSTLNRILCNHLLSWTQAKKIAYLDLDPGQPEFGPPGQLSLVNISAPIFGPPFTHPAWAGSNKYELVRGHTIAATSFKADPDLYVACALDLAKHVDTNCPLVVNTCGWVTGLGATVLAELASSLGITDVVLLGLLDDSLVTSLRDAPNPPALHHVPRQPSRPSPRAPAEMRAMQTMSYMHHLQNRPGGSSKWSGRCLCVCRPWIVDYAGPEPGIVAIASYDQKPHPNYLAEVLDGSIVAIVVLDPGSDISDAFLPDHSSTAGLGWPISRTKYGDLPYILDTPSGTTHALDPRTSRCAGIALVRAIDAETKRLHLVTPLADSEIAALAQRRVILVRGSLDAPGWAYLEDVYENGGEGRNSGKSDDDRPWVSTKEMTGIEGAVWRLRHPPLATSHSGGGKTR